MNTKLDALSLKAGFEQFNSPRQEGDIDLIDLVRQALINNGVLETTVSQFYDNHTLIREAKDKQPHVQQWQLNRYWTYQLTSMSGTGYVREYLIQDGTAEDWLRLFSQHVLPSALKLGLPKNLYDNQTKTN